MFIIAANWKMNGDVAFALNYAAQLDKFITEARFSHEIIILPPYPLFSSLKGNFKIGGQNCHSEEKGAFTGEVSAALLKDMGCSYVLLGHSERRQMGETSDQVNLKGETAHNSGLKTIICVGEKEGENFTRIVTQQLDKSIPASATAANTVIAYEPVWAIGTGKTPSVEEISARQSFIKDKTAFTVLYGGSVKADNAAEISNAANVGGLLVGGASLDVEQFKQIISARRNA